MPAKIENLRPDDYDLDIKESFIIEDFNVNNASLTIRRAL